jgi:BirA family transcriptional regulator, biotin operon repressor / biotin---[acetyl-CoA-carboxylase] ligase
MSRLPPDYRLVSYDTVGSTNDEAKRLAREGAAEGTIVWALVQTAGRGRRGSLWASPRGNLYASLLLRPDAPARRALQLGFVAAVALGDALSTTVPGLSGLSYKWPNDVLLGGRKLAGILLEAESGGGEGLAFLVVGFGVNLVSSPQEAEFPATSLAEQQLGPIAPGAVLEAFAWRFRDWAQRWREEGFAPVRAAWRARAAMLGEPIRVRLGSVTLYGRARDLDQRGELLLETADGLRQISTGQVFPPIPR